MMRAVARLARGEMHDQDAAPEFLIVKEVASLLRTTPKAIYTMVERAQIPGVLRIGRRLLFRREVLLQWLLEKSGTPSPEGDRR
jgi:excisionase family DNA binding protein